MSNQHTERDGAWKRNFNIYFEYVDTKYWLFLESYVSALMKIFLVYLVQEPYKRESNYVWILQYS